MDAQLRITSDQGTQFGSSVSSKLCARLAIWRAFSQTNRPQAHGRAEVAGRTGINVLRKIQQDHNIKWLESLPRRLRSRHYLPDKETGSSAYQIVLGRQRALEGWSTPSIGRFAYFHFPKSIRCWGFKKWQGNHGFICATQF